MDTEGIEAFMQIVQKLKGLRIVVSHSEELISMGFDRVLKVEKIDGISRIVEV
jgi:DNA repair exonuclease SbcCD ATPase subunit